MPRNNFIQDALGTKRGAGVDENHSLRVSEYAPDVPPVGTKSNYRFITGLVGSTGLDSGTTDMNVDGSSTPQTFYVGANSEYDIRIMGISILIADTGIVHNNFGTLSALSNGWDLILREGGESTTLINKAKTNGEVIVYTGSGRPFGDGAQSWELLNWNATDDALLCYYTMNEYVPGGLRIARGSDDRLRSVVNDDLTGLTNFFVRIFGYKHYPVGF